MKEKTKEIADEVGAVYPVLSMGRHDCVLFTETELEAFVTLVAAAELRPWQGLTNDDRFEIAAEQHGWEDLLIAAEAKLKERNT